MKKFLALFLLLVSLLPLHAQQAVEMADVMRSNGKIYVVVAVLAVILIGLLIYLVVIDRKLSKLEKDLNKKT